MSFIRSHGIASGNVAYTYTSSATAVATVTAAGVVTAVAPGTATITVSAAGTGTGFAATTLTTAATVTVSDRVPGLTSLQVSPTTVAMAVGGTQQVTATPQGPRASAATISYGTSAPSIATVDASGVITALAQGTAVITVTAQSTESGQFGASSLTGLVTVTVAPLPNATVADILQGPTVSRLIDSTYSAGSGGVLAGIDFSPNAQVDRSVDILNVRDQIQIDVNLQPNGQKIAKLETFLCWIGDGSPNASVCNNYEGMAAEPATIQEFLNGDVNAGTLRVRINTAEFKINADSGTAKVRHVNGRYVVKTRLVSLSGAELHNSVDTRAILSLNNLDGFALALNRPANSATDVNSRTWWGGPTVSDIGQPSGLGSFRLYDVIYTRGRTIAEVTARFGACGTAVDAARPWDFTYGRAADASGAAFINCDGVTGAYDAGDAFRFEDFPMVTASRDNQANPGPRVIYGYNPVAGTDPFGPRPQWFRYANEQPVGLQTAMRVDYEKPALTLTVRGATGQRWVNDTWAFNSSSPTTGPNYTQTELGVGLFASRNTRFEVNNWAGVGGICVRNATWVSVPGGLAATIADIPSSPDEAGLNNDALRQHKCDLTENAYRAEATETDRLGNRGRSMASANSQFGIDNVAPTYTYGGGDPAQLAANGGIYQPARSATADYPEVTEAGNTTNRQFRSTYSDERSGFDFTDHGTRTVRRIFPNASPLLSNVANTETWTRTMNFNAGAGAANPVDPSDLTRRVDSVFVYGAGTLLRTTLAEAGARSTAIAQPASGYYEYTLMLRDRAGNSVTNPTVRVALDATSPLITGVTLPSVLGAQASETAFRQGIMPTGTDDLEAIDFEMYLRYPQMEQVGDLSNGSFRFTGMTAGASRIRFPRYATATPLSLARVHAPFGFLQAPFGPNGEFLLATPFGPGAVLTDAAAVFSTRDNFRGLLMPINTIRSLESVDPTDAPIAWAQGGSPSGANTFKPTRIGLYAFDIRSTAPAVSDMLWRGMSNRFPSATDIGEAAYTDSIFQANVSNGQVWWNQDLDADASNGTQRVLTWAIFNTTQARITTTTELVRNPFREVHYVIWTPRTAVNGGVSQASPTVPGATTATTDSSGAWVYIGTVTAPSIVDQGSTRIWTYGVPSTLVAGSCYRAIGVDMNGDALATQAFGTGCPATTTVTAASATITFRAYGNGSGNLTTNLDNSTTDLATAAYPDNRFLTITKGAASAAVVSATRAMTAVSAGGTDLFVRITPDAGQQIGVRPSGCDAILRLSGGGWVADNNVYPTTDVLACRVTDGLTTRTITALFERAGQ